MNNFIRNERIEKLRSKVLGAPEICVERLRYMTESYKETEGEPFVLRRAKAMEHVFKNMTIRIDDGELIVGNSTGKDRGAPIIAELQWQWYLNEMDDLSVRKWDRCKPISEDEKAVMRECLPYWEGNTPADHWMDNGVDPIALKNQEYYPRNRGEDISRKREF